MTVIVHADPLDMVTYVRGCLSEARAEEVRKHCFACRDCGDQLAAIILLRGAAPVRASVPWYASRWVAAAAGVVLLVGASAWLVGLGVGAGPRGVVDNGDVVASPDRSIDSLPGAGGFAALTAADVEIINLIALVEGQLSGLEVPAAAGSEAADTLSSVQAGVGALAGGDYGKAAGYLDRFGDSYHPAGTYLLGLALFFEGSRLPDARQALETHLSALGDPGRTDWDSAGRTTAYYLARLHLEAGRSGAARQLLRQAATVGATDLALESDLDLVQTAVRQLLLELD